MEMANRLEHMGKEKYKGLTRKTAKGNIIWNGKVNIDMNDKALYEPLQRKKPTMYFVNSMTDLFQEGVPFEAIDKIMSVIALCPQHTFQVLTKRPERMKEYFERLSIQVCKLRYPKAETESWHFKENQIEVHNCGNISPQRCADLYYSKQEVWNYIENRDVQYNFSSKEFETQVGAKTFVYINKLPLPNLWLGVSVENQEQADKRIPFLLETPAKVRFLSCEPLLGYITLKRIEKNATNPYFNCLNQIDWVIVGGESGHNARPMHPDWVRSIKDQCKDANVRFFFKQFSSNNNKDYKNYEKFPKDLQIREFPRS
jgi:protein gp37